MSLDEVIVGSCTYALLKSYSGNIPIVLTAFDGPTLDLEFSSKIQIENLETKREIEAWQMLKFLCSMRGLVVNPRHLSYVRVEAECIRFKNTEISFNKCHLFPSKDVKCELEILKTEQEGLFKILDFMRLKSCSASNIDTIIPKDTFIKQVKCFGKKEVVAVSLLSKEQLTDFDYSDTIVRFMTQKILLSNEALHRPLISKDSESRRSPALTVLERKVVPVSEAVYKSSKKVRYYDRKKRNDILETYCRYNSSLQS